jgi:cobalt/nickel transport system ATP-binding protein
MLARGYDGDLREPGTVKQTQDRIENPAADTPKDCKNNGAFPPYSDLDVEIDEVSYSYPDGRQALNNISLKIRAGEKIALLGMNGAGKSTLLWHLNGLLPNDHRAGSTGLVRVCGLDVREPMLKRVRAMVGLVFQNPDDQLFSPSVYEDIAYAPIYQGLTAELVKETVFASLRGVGMEDYSSRVPYHLSSGEKKRISIATVLASKPVVLALDEPTAGLDPNARRSLIDLLAGLPQSMLVATHDLSLAARMLPRSIILYKGMVVADGPTDSLLQDHRLLEQYGLV